MSRTEITFGDATAMVRAATAQAADGLPAVIERFMLPVVGRGHLTETEAALALAALAELLRARVEYVLAKHVTGSETLLSLLDRHIAERIEDAQGVAAKREAAHV